MNGSPLPAIKDPNNFRIARSMHGMATMFHSSSYEAHDRARAFYDRCKERGIEWPPVTSNSTSINR